MNKRYLLGLVLGLSLVQACFAPVMPGHWQVTQVAVTDWVDYTQYFDSGDIVSFDVNTGDIGATGEYIWSGFANYSPNSYSLTCQSQGPIRYKFEWVGGGTVPSTITFDYWTEAIADVVGPTGSFSVDAYYVLVDGHSPTINSSSSGGMSGYTVTSTGTNTYGVSTGGSSVVYYDAPGFLNSMTATLSYGASIYCESACAVTVH